VPALDYLVWEFSRQAVDRAWAAAFGLRISHLGNGDVLFEGARFSVLIPLSLIEKPVESRDDYWRRVGAVL